MRILARNKKNVWYANPETITPVVDENGLRTGTNIVSYGTPTKVRMSVSVSSGANNLGSQGMAELEQYGIVSAYTHRMTTDNLNCPITEESLIWYRKTPGETFDEVPHNFKVVRIARSDNHVTYYVKEADVS